MFPPLALGPPMSEARPLSTASLIVPLSPAVPTDRFLAAIVESSDDAIIGKTLEGTITSWNRGAERLYGYVAEEAVGQPISLIIPPERQDEEPEMIGSRFVIEFQRSSGRSTSE